MTNQTILSLLNQLSNKARNSVHSGLGSTLNERLGFDPAWQICLQNSKSNVDRLLRTIDDIRELLSTDRPPFSLAEEFTEEFDVAVCLGEVIAALNLESGGRSNRLTLQSPAQPVAGWQHRCAIEEALTRILGAVLNIGKNEATRVTVADSAAGDGFRLEIVPANSKVALNVADWMNADPELVNFATADDVLYGLATMVAGKRIRALGGSAQLLPGVGAPVALLIVIPWQHDSEAASHPESSFHDQPGLHVLVVEDSDENFLLTGILLEPERVSRARNGLEALSMMKARRFDVVLMDVHMPGMDGYQALQAMREWEKQTGNARTPIVVLSSDDLDTQMRSAQAGCSGFLRKPVEDDELRVLLDRFKAIQTLTG